MDLHEIMTIDQARIEATEVLQIFVGWVVSPQFYAQIGAIIFALGYWVAGTEGYSSEIHFLVWDTLTEAGIPLVPVK